MGALTSKPYAFRSRPWELQAIETFDFLDALCSPIRVDVRGLQAVRILPRPVNFNNDLWINDRTRFFIDGLKRQRLGTPLLRVSSFNIPLSWRGSFDVLKDKATMPKTTLHGIVGPNTTFPVIKQFKHFINSLGSETICTDFHNINIDLHTQPSLNSLMAEEKGYDAIILLNSNLRVEYPLLNAHFRQIAKTKPIFSFGFVNDPYIQNLGTIPEFIALVKGKSKLSKLFSQYKKILVIVGMSTSNNILLSSGTISTFLDMLIRQTVSVFLFYLPQFLAGAASVFLNIKNNTSQSIAQHKVLYLLNSDSITPTRGTYKFIVYHGSHGGKAAAFANLILPSETIFESKDAYSFSLDGSFVKYNFAYSAPLEARSQLATFEMLNKFFGFNVGDTNSTFKRLFSNQIFSTFSYKKARISSIASHVIHNFHLRDAVTKASPTLTLASSRFSKNAEVRNNYFSD